MHHTFWYIPSLHWKRPEISSSDDLWRTTNHKTIKKWVRFLTIQPQENSFHYSEIFLAIVPSWSWLQLPITGWRIKSIRLVEATAKRTTKTCNVLQHCCKRNSWIAPILRVLPPTNHEPVLQHIKLLQDAKSYCRNKRVVVLFATKSVHVACFTELSTANLFAASDVTRSHGVARLYFYPIDIRGSYWRNLQRPYLLQDRFKRCW